MRKLPLRISIFFLVFPLFAILNCGRQGDKVDVEADIAAINEIWNQYALSINSGDLDTWISLWTDNGIQMAPDAPAVIEKEQIRAKYESIFPQFIFKLAITNKEIRVAGDRAYSRGTYSLSVTPITEGETTMIDGKYLTILERQADGSWKITRDCFNYNAPPTSEPPSSEG